MQEKSAQAENELWNAVGEVLDAEMSTVEDILESLARTQKGNVKSSIENCMTILYRDPVLKDAICKNELTNKIDIVKALFWKRNGNCITDVDMYQIQRYIETNYGISNDKAINKAVSIAASEKSYHPIREFLENLHWDGKSRIADLLPRFLGADDNEYTREIMRLLMLAAVRRIYEPGCKFEIMVCLVGGQGAGKSTFFRFLAVNDEWFTDDLKRMDDENVYSKMQGHWIIEMSEMLATVNAKSIEDIKDIYKSQYNSNVVYYSEENENGFLSSGILSGKDSMSVSVFGNEDRILLVARYDNLGKGASGAAVECLNYILGVDKVTDLEL